MKKNQKTVKLLVIMVLSLSIIFVGTGCSSEQGSETKVDSEYIAKVNGETISLEDYQNQVAILKESISYQYGVDPAADPQLLANIETQALQSLVHELLVIQEAGKRGIVASEEEIDAAIGRIQSGFADEETFTQALSDNGMSIDGLREQIRKDILINTMIEQVYTEKAGKSEAALTGNDDSEQIIQEFLEELVDKAQISYNREYR